MNDTRDTTPPHPPEDPLSFPPEAEVHEPLSVRFVLRRFKILAVQGAALLGVCLLLLLLGTGTAGWYTSRSQFCNSCHIMEPYYVSWQESSHRDVACTKCHFPPGVAEKVRGKVLGLVQLAKYVTQTQGPRPSAEIPDASCLRSGCHETRLLSGRVDYNGIAFDHARHYGESTRGIQLRCTSCHSQIVQGQHMTVTPTTCFLCHFKNEFFNEGLGACTRCHQIPEESFDLGGGVPFTHALAYEQGVDCQSCHADLIRGNGEVPVERCTVCHNREHDLERIGDVMFIHQTHVADHKVDCLSCHLQLHHSLDTNSVATAAAECSKCHLNPHDMQVAMLEGKGARLIPEHRSSMLAARLSCFTCHKQKEVSPTGSVLMKASLQTCVGCHASHEIAGLQTYHEQLRELLVTLENDLPRVETSLAEASLEPTQRAELTRRLNDLQHDIRFLHAGNDIHNSHYASELTDQVLEQLTDLCRTLDLEPPDVQLPEKPSPVTTAGAADEPATADAAPGDERETDPSEPTELPAADEPDATDATPADAPEPSPDSAGDPDAAEPLPTDDQNRS